MDLNKNGKLLYELRKSKGMTQKELADKLGVVPKTVSKWETGHGFPDISTLPALADIFGVSEKILLSGNIILYPKENGNMKRIKFYVCPNCNSIMQGTGNSQIICCGKTLEHLQVNPPDDRHTITISEIEDEFYIEFNHEMTKEHYIVFVSYIKFDRILTVRLYPEQDPAIRIPKMYGGQIIYYCNKEGLFSFSPVTKRTR